MEPEKDMFDQWKEDNDNKSWLSKKIKSISLWWYFDGRHLIRDFIEGTKNLYNWFPIIWKDRNWDHSYIYEILEHKIKLQSKYIGEKDRHTEAKRDSEIMNTYVNLSIKCREEFYATEFLDYQKTKNWFEDCDDKEGYSTWESREISENFDDYFKKYPLIYKRVINGEGIFKNKGKKKDKQIIAMNIARINQSRAHKLMFKIIEENINKWWD